MSGAKEYTLQNYPQEPVDWFDRVRETAGVTVIDVVERDHDGQSVPVIALITADATAIAELRQKLPPQVRLAFNRTNPPPPDQHHIG